MRASFFANFRPPLAKKLRASFARLAALAAGRKPAAQRAAGPAPGPPDGHELVLAGQSVLRPGQYMVPGSALFSSDYFLTGGYGLFVHFNADADLVAYYRDPKGDAPRWSSGTAGTGANYLLMQDDGNLVLYDTRTAPWTALWESGTAGHPGAYLTVSPGSGAYFDQALLLYRPDGALCKALRANWP